MTTLLEIINVRVVIENTNNDPNAIIIIIVHAPQSFTESWFVLLFLIFDKTHFDAGRYLYTYTCSYFNLDRTRNRFGQTRGRQCKRNTYKRALDVIKTFDRGKMLTNNNIVFVINVVASV